MFGGTLTLGELVEWLEQQNPEMVVKDGFGRPHADRGDYSNLAFAPMAEARLGDMLAHAKLAIGVTFEGYKGGDYEMHEHTETRIGAWGECGEAITPTHLKYWLLTAKVFTD